VKRAIAVLVLVLVVAFAYPLAMQETWGECDALEQQVFGEMLAKLGSGEDADQEAALRLGFSTDGRVATTYIRHRHPDVPPVLGCTFAYWRNVVNGGVVMDREWLQALPTIDLPELNLEGLERAVKGSDQ
jgi:hypothetical protein